MTDEADALENEDELAELDAAAAEAEPGVDENGQEVEQVEQPSLSNQQALSMLMRPAFELLAPRWNVKPEEVDRLATAYGDLADKYMPAGMTVGVELNAALITVIILGPRLGVPRNDAAAERAEKKRAAKEKPKPEPEAQANADDQGETSPPAALDGLTDDGGPGVEDAAS